MAGGLNFPNDDYCGKYPTDEGGPSGLQDDFMDAEPLDFSIRKPLNTMDDRMDSDSDDQEYFNSNNTGARPKTRTSPTSDHDESKYGYRSRPRSCSPYPVFDPYALQSNQAFSAHMPAASSSPPMGLPANINPAQLAQFQNPTALLALQTLMQSRNAMEKQAQSFYPYTTPRNSPSPPSHQSSSSLTSTSGISSGLSSTSGLPSMSSLSSSLPSMSGLSSALPSTTGLSGLPSTSSLPSGLPSTSGLYAAANAAYGMRVSHIDDERMLRDNSFETDGLDNGLRSGIISPGRIMPNVSGTSSGKKLEGLGNLGGPIGTPLAALGFRGPPHYGYLTGTKAEVEINCTSHANYLRFREEMMKQVQATKARRSSANRADKNGEDGDRSDDNGVENVDGLEGAVGGLEGAVGGVDAEGFVGGAVMNEQSGADGLIDNEGRAGNDNNNNRGNGRGRGRQGANNVVKDEAYWERRRRNNEAAKRSRDARRAKEDETAIRAAFLEQENLQLKIELSTLKATVPKYEKIAYS